MLSSTDTLRVARFLVHEWGIDPTRIVRNMHITVYFADRPLDGVLSFEEPATVVIPAVRTRFMVMARGGEIPRPDIEPANRKIGIRIQRQSVAMDTIFAYRQRILNYETAAALGHKPPSSRKRSAFGAPHFQPHMTLLTPGSGVNRDLTKLGSLFRERIGNLQYDRFIVDVVGT